MKSRRNGSSAAAIGAVALMVMLPVFAAAQAIFNPKDWDGKLGPVFQGNEEVFHGFNAARKLRYDFHYRQSPFLIELPYNNV